LSVLADLLLGTGLTAVFWGYVCAAFLEAFGIAGTTPWVFIASGVSFAWGYGLDRLTRKADPGHRNHLVLLGWLSPIVTSGIFLVIVWLKPGGLSWDITISAEVPLYLLLWALCSVQGINRARSSSLVISQHNALAGTLILALVASFRVSRSVNLASGALIFALLSTLDVALVRQRQVLSTVHPGQRRYWAAGGAGFLALALTIAAFASMGVPGAVSFISQVVSRVWDIISTIIIYMVIPIAWIAEWLVMRLRERLQLNTRESQGIPPLRKQLLEQLEEQASELVQLPPWAHAVLTGLAVAAALWLIWRFVLKRGPLKPQESQLKETRTSLLEKDAFREWAKSSMDEMLARVRSGVTKALGSILSNEPRTIQELYMRSLELLSKRVHPREQSQTPLEYLGSILKHVPSQAGREAFSYITELFCRCHYSGKPPQASEWEKAVHAYSVLTQAETLHLESRDTG